MTTSTKLARLLAGTAVVGLTLTGCGAAAESGSGATPAGSAAAEQSAHNDADVTFAQDMIVHHRQAVEMAELAAGRSQNPQLLDLAARIGGAQGPEIDTLTGWLQEWGAEVPAEDAAMGGMAGMDHGGMSGMEGMGGMMSEEDMTSLEQASGSEFDRMFLRMMTEHHSGAVEMAQTEVDEGSDPRATRLAQTIIDTQEAEIAEMEQLLTQV